MIATGGCRRGTHPNAETDLCPQDLQLPRLSAVRKATDDRRPIMEQPHHHRHPLLRGVGHALGVLYLLVTLLFGPIQSLARWLERQRIVQRYERWVGELPPAAGLTVSLLSLGLLEIA